MSEGRRWRASLPLLRDQRETPIALTLTLIVAALAMGGRGLSGSAIEKTFESALGPVSPVILITRRRWHVGRRTSIGDALEDVLSDLGIPVILAGFLIAAVMRRGAGSPTVALTTAAGLIAPAVLAGGCLTGSAGRHGGGRGGRFRGALPRQRPGYGWWAASWRWTCAPPSSLDGAGDHHRRGRSPVAAVICRLAGTFDAPPPERDRPARSISFQGRGALPFWTGDRSAPVRSA
ncbi:hypothetical protein QJS66_10160 [Kocuria rhizophila]|nr:hypothetical protein QJS66_10160 [Kocuria rhizophila]